MSLGGGTLFSKTRNRGREKREEVRGRNSLRGVPKEEEIKREISVMKMVEQPTLSILYEPKKGHIAMVIHKACTEVHYTSMWQHDHRKDGHAYGCVVHIEEFDP